jgi:hypothetical protein
MVTEEKRRAAGAYSEGGVFPFEADKVDPSRILAVVGREEESEALDGGELGGSGRKTVSQTSPCCGINEAMRIPHGVFDYTSCQGNVEALRNVERGGFVKVERLIRELQAGG